ncbi:MAG: tRNA (adenosine(37)-N6)-dimethylallyltransferase MiaA [Acidimicrobiia bacterium]|nr:tRNA (adenosine(37)-N6)-dimethylallyltransferase MiaA [Acidimicrobiia bacterium]
MRGFRSSRRGALRNDHLGRSAPFDGCTRLLRVIAILGPTASGKSAVAMRLAETLDGHIWSVDSMQVYRHMDIGTAKPTTTERERITHHLIDLVEPEDRYSVADFQRSGAAALRQAASQPIICGGSGLHFRALIDPLDFPPTSPAVREELEALSSVEVTRRLLDLDSTADQHVDLANPRRVIRALEIATLTGATPSERAADPRTVAVREFRSDVEVHAFGIDPGKHLSERITRRFDAMLSAGLVDEVRRLAPRLGVTAARAVGYREMLAVVNGDHSMAEGRKAAIQATVHLAKRQRTYFRKDPRIRWLPWHDDPNVLTERVLEMLRTE